MKLFEMLFWINFIINVFLKSFFFWRKSTLSVQEHLTEFLALMTILKNWQGSDHVTKPENIVHYPTTHLRNKLLYIWICQRGLNSGPWTRVSFGLWHRVNSIQTFWRNILPPSLKTEALCSSEMFAIYGRYHTAPQPEEQNCHY